MLFRSSDRFIPFLRNSINYTDFDTAIENRALNYLYFENTMRIEYLDSFGASSELAQTQYFSTSTPTEVSNPVWKTLNQRVYDLIGAERSIFCRLVPYENSNLRIIADKDIVESAYDKYFILEGIQPTPPGPIFGASPQTRSTTQQPSVVQPTPTTLTANTDIPAVSSGNTGSPNLLQATMPSYNSSEYLTGLTQHAAGLNLQTINTNITSTTNNPISNFTIANLRIMRT